MNLEDMTQEQVEAELNKELLLYVEHPEDDILRDNFNALQIYHNVMFGSFHKVQLPTPEVPNVNYVWQQER